MNKLVKIIIGIILLFLCIAFTVSLSHSIAKWDFTEKSQLIFFGGVVTYFILHLLFLRPIFVHVIGHEITHALWALVFGGRVKSMEVSSEGGNVVVDKTNFIITLAPYFFPIYTIILIALYFLIKIEYLPYIVFFIGFTWSFHIMLTMYSLRVKQTDFKESGFLFSITFVYLMNIFILSLILALISPNTIKLEQILKNFIDILIQIVYWVVKEVKIK
ncbi:MAG: hypothetical protein AABY84_05895 [Candidatus Firestonebacteria bacterium]